MPNPPVNSSRYYARRFAERAAARGRDTSFRVLDAGAGSAPYRDLFGHLTYETADVAATPGKDYSHITYVCDVVDLPVEDERYDLVWCSQTLEHVRDPLRALAEFRRVLKPGGECWLTAPFSYAEHETPYDYYRFTQFAWRHFADVVGFEVLEIERLEGCYGTMSYTLQMAARHLPDHLAGRRGVLRRLARELAELDLVDKRTDVGMPKNYQVVYRRP